MATWPERISFRGRSKAWWVFALHCLEHLAALLLVHCLESASASTASANDQPESVSLAGTRQHLVHLHQATGDHSWWQFLSNLCRFNQNVCGKMWFGNGRVSGLPEIKLNYFRPILSSVFLSTATGCFCFVKLKWLRGDFCEWPRADLARGKLQFKDGFRRRYHRRTKNRVRRLVTRLLFCFVSPFEVG